METGVEHKKVKRKIKENIEYEHCIICGKELDIPVDMHIDDRQYYVEGTGQLCEKCYQKLYITHTETKTVKDSLGYTFSKRVLDIIGGILGCLITIIFVFVIKIAYMLEGDFKTIFFSQERIGKDGKIFKIFKFRSMIPNAEEELNKLMIENEDIRNEYMTNKKLSNDPRITKIGRFIRKTSIDEFPQFLNVLIGNMSLVGPRPYLMREIEDMGQAYNDIIKVKPGITGPWQVGGRSDVSFLYRVKIEREYVFEHTFFNDIKILLKTLKSAFFGEGAK